MGSLLRFDGARCSLVTVAREGRSSIVEVRSRKPKPFSQLLSSDHFQVPNPSPKYSSSRAAFSQVLLSGKLLSGLQIRGVGGLLHREPHKLDLQERDQIRGHPLQHQHRGIQHRLVQRFSLLAAGPNPHEVISRWRPTLFSFPPLPARRSRRVGCRGGPGFVTFALTSGSSDRASSSIGKELNTQFFASVTSSGNGQLTTSSAIAPIPVLSSSSSMGSPLFWIGVGVGLSVIFQVVMAFASQNFTCIAFVDVSPEELFHNERSFMNEVSKASPMETQSAKEIQTNGTVKQNASSSTEQPDYRNAFYKKAFAEKKVFHFCKLSFCSLKKRCISASFLSFRKHFISEPTVQSVQSSQRS
ncbi:hypothetical protein ZIOFF_003904 [Zingiber officinale]|uniref:Uncharacterized protein n=1 Tax=Zingiber officinale TaxID=94328 RepID=A0A8J5I773_ZINOF|nr:hypothetical protein ZIOFF_003904 [Zingiber officinale]